jgi:hypothetical protein
VIPDVVEQGRVSLVSVDRFPTIVRIKRQVPSGCFTHDLGAAEVVLGGVHNVFERAA